MTRHGPASGELYSTKLNQGDTMPNLMELFGQLSVFAKLTMAVREVSADGIERVDNIAIHFTPQSRRQPS